MSETNELDVMRDLVDTLKKFPTIQRSSVPMESIDTDTP